MLQSGLGVAGNGPGGETGQARFRREEIRGGREEARGVCKGGLTVAGTLRSVGAIMTQDQDNITTMFETTNGVLDNNTKKWEGIPAFADAVARAESGTGAVRDRAGGQAATGDAKAKATLRDDLEERTLLIADQLSALAVKTGDAGLAATVDFNKSQLDRMADSVLIAAAGAVKKAAEANSAKLAADYQISAADLAAQAGALSKFDRKKTSPRDAAVNRKVATMALPDAIAYVRGIYRNELDKMMSRFKKTDPDFFAAYTAARMIVDRSAKRTARPATKPEASPK